MALHDTLRELVRARGAGVVRDANEFRGVLDDYLAEDEATVGEVNLLVDAVRLGAVSRLVSMLDEGAVPASAVADAGASLARDRGSDDQARAMWAVAAVGHALGRVDSSLVDHPPSTSGPSGSTGAPQPPPPLPPSPGPDTVASSEAVPTSMQDSAPLPAPAFPQPGPPPPPAPPGPSLSQPVPTRRRRGPLLLVISFALLLGLVGGTGLALWMQRDTGADDADPEGPTNGTTEQPPEKDAIPDEGIIVNYVEGADLPVDQRDSRVFRVNAEDGKHKELAPDRAANQILPTISPDRTMVTFLEGEEGLRVLQLLDVNTDEVSSVFEESGPCQYAERPGWLPGTTQIAVVCNGDDDLPEGIYTYDVAEGGEPQMVVEDSQVSGSPTWLTRQYFVYVVVEGEKGPRSFRLGNTDGDEAPLLDPDDVGGVTITHPDWHEQEEKLLFLVHSELETEYGQIWTADIDPSTGEVANIVQLSEQEYAHPVWSPDGNQIAATVADENDADVLVTIPVDDPEGYVTVPNTPEGRTAGIPVWGNR